METGDKVHSRAFEIWLFFSSQPLQDKLKARSTSHAEKYFWLNGFLRYSRGSKN